LKPDAYLLTLTAVSHRLTRLTCIVFCLGVAARAQAGLPRATAVRVEHAPIIDGRIDDPAWSLIPAQDSFTQVEPAQGKPPTERTQFRVAYDDAQVYVAVSCLDSDPGRIASRLTRRDRDIEADWVAVSIDSRNDRNSAFTFQLSAAGVQVDGQVYNDTEFSVDWDAVWQGKVAHDGQGWSAEFAIPLTVLRFSSADAQTWGFQVHRNVSRKREQAMWSYDGSGKTWGVSHFGYVEGLTGLRPRRAFELRPYVAVAAVSNNLEGGGFFGASTDAEHGMELEAGLDLKAGLTPRLTMDLTINPDFGQVEADQVVLNLSRFETFFPEKRPFFLEGTDVFTTTIQLFYPRRIGRPAVGVGRGGVVVERNTPLTVTDAEGILRLWTAAKLTGEVGDKVSLGALAALVGAEEVTAVDPNGTARTVELAPLRTYGVLRGRYALGGGSFLGVMATGVTRLGAEIKRAFADHDAYVQAVDVFTKTANGRLIAQAQLAVTERIGGPSHQDENGRACPAESAATDFSCVPIARPDGTQLPPGSVGLGLEARSNYETSHSLLKIEYAGHSAKFDPNDAGFAPNFNFNELKLVGGFMKKQPDEWSNFRGIFPIAIGSVSMEGTPQWALIGADIEWTFKNFAFTSPEQWLNLPGTWDIYETFDGARFEVPVAWEGSWQFGSNKAKALAVDANLQWLLAFNDEQRRLSGAVTLYWQARSNIELSLGGNAGTEHATRFYDCATDSGRACLVEPGMRHYTFADLDSRFVSLTLRGTLTLRPELSFQTYLQYFVAKGDYSDFKRIDTVGQHPEIRRDDLRPSDLMIEDGFESTNLNANFVMRWEVRPGSTFYAVYTRAQAASVTAPGRLDEGPTEDVALLKFVYFVD